MKKDNKKFVVESNFIKEALNKNLSLREFLILLYFDNSYDDFFDVQKIAKEMKMTEEEVMKAFSLLLAKKIIKVDTKQNEYGKLVENINLDNFYINIFTEEKSKEKTTSESNIFTTFESEFGRSLSPMDYEIIKAWIEKGSSEELILGALKEAKYNGVLNLRYIDKIIYEWNKKGFKNMQDVNKYLDEKNNPTVLEEKVLDYNWLDENE